MGISVIIPALNEEKFIGQCLDSISSQLQKGDEIIVVDNGSTDGTVKIAKRLGAKVIKEKKRGISNARNAGAKKAKGNIICFVDADALVSDDWLHIIRASFKKENYDAVVGVNIFKESNKIYFIWYNIYTFFAYIYTYLQLLTLGRLFLTGNNLAIKRSLFLSLGGFDPVVGEDFWFTEKFWKKGIKRKVTLNRKMVVWCSTRGFKEVGYIKTIAYWIVATLTRKSQENYSYKSKPLIK